jgi:hypothetical protein
MESLEIESKKDIRRKQNGKSITENDISLSLPLSLDKVFYYRAIHQRFFRIQFQQIHFENKESFAWSFRIKEKFKSLKIILNSSIAPARKCVAILLPPNCFFENGGLLTYSSVSQIFDLVLERTSDPSPTWTWPWWAGRSPSLPQA